jgi:hypothetical protein
VTMATNSRTTSLWQADALAFRKRSFHRRANAVLTGKRKLLALMLRYMEIYLVCSGSVRTAVHGTVESFDWHDSVVMTISWSGQSTMAVPLNTRKRYCAVLMWRQWRVCRFVRSKQWESLKTPLFQLPSREWTIFGSCVMRYFEIVIIM